MNYASSLYGFDQVARKTAAAPAEEQEEFPEAICALMEMPNEMPKQSPFRFPCPAGSNLSNLPCTSSYPDGWPATTSYSLLSQITETVPDRLFDYTMNQVPPELRDANLEDILEQPDENNIVVVPKEVLARICEMLTPKEFGTLARTCRLLHWRMMRFCRCTVKHLEVWTKESGRRTNGELRVDISSKMIYSLARKHIYFEKVTFVLWNPTIEMLYKLTTQIGRRSNVKHLSVELEDREDKPVNLDDFDEWDRQLTWLIRPTHTRSGHLLNYDALKDKPIATIESHIKRFLSKEVTDYERTHYYFAREHRQELVKRMADITRWAELNKGWSCHSYMDGAEPWEDEYDCFDYTKDTAMSRRCDVEIHRRYVSLYIGPSYSN